MSASFENSAEVTELGKVTFHSNPKERQYQRMFKLLYNCPHFTQCSKYRLTPSQPHTKALLASVLFTCQIIPGFQPKNQKICQRQLCIFSNMYIFFLPNKRSTLPTFSVSFRLCHYTSYPHRVPAAMLMFCRILVLQRYSSGIHPSVIFLFV